ncbi:hypothetical protein [Microbulbifer aggregans]|uniref:hypothetical protein n=1 Tax=Microbulbifer aggregans TaxID=1769779 RepID=UPI001CFD1A83|nr:hypothetical protein [Microbulbifer aggregans]
MGSDTDGNSECTNPKGARETIIHLLTKAVLLKLTSFYLPEKLVGVGEYRGHLIKDFEVQPSEEWMVTNGREEDRSIHSRFVPDVIFDTPKGPLIIEVLYSHKVDDGKRLLLSELGFYAVELDVSKLHPDEVGLTPITQRLYDPRYCTWISYPLSRHDQANLEAWRVNETKRIDELAFQEQKEKERQECQQKAIEQSRLELIEQAKILKERRRRQQKAEDRAALQDDYKEIIKRYFKSAGAIYDLKPIGASEQNNIKVALRVLCSELDNAFPDGAPLDLGQRLRNEVKRQVKERKAFIKNTRLESAASLYIFENMDQEFAELVALDWRGDTIEVPGRSNDGVAYLNQKIPEKIKKFLQGHVDQLGLVKARSDNWPYKTLNRTPL